MEVVKRASHSGVWKITGYDGSEIAIECYVMDDEERERVLSLRGAGRAAGLIGAGSFAVARNLSSAWIRPYLSEELREWLTLAARNELPEYVGLRGKSFTPFKASLFVDLCKAYIDAERDGVLKTDTQLAISRRLYAIMTAFAKVGIDAIIDEITGYQEDRDRAELQKILKKYVSPVLLPWTARFPTTFYTEMFRLWGWQYKGKAKSPMVGKLTNQYVYDYLPPGVLSELQEKNPVDPTTKRRRNKHHQYLTQQTGIQHLDRHLIQTMALMAASDTREEFDRLFKKAMGEPHQLSIDTRILDGK